MTPLPLLLTIKGFMSTSIKREAFFSANLPNFKIVSISDFISPLGLPL